MANISDSPVSDAAGNTPAASPLHLPAQISMPCRHVLVCEPRCDIKHDDSTLAVNVIAVTQASKLFLPGCVPAVEPQFATICGKVKGMYFHTNCCCKTWCGQVIVSRVQAESHKTSNDSRSYFFSNSPVKWRFTKVVLPATRLQDSIL